MSHKNPIKQKMFELDMSDKEATKQIYETYKDTFQDRDIVLDVKRFNLVKHGHDTAQWLRTIIADFFGVPEQEIPRKK